MNNQTVYNALGQPVQLIDNVFTAGVVQTAPAAVVVSTEQPKVQYYAAPADMQLTTPHAAVNLAQPTHVVPQVQAAGTATGDGVATTTVVYQAAQQEQQQQPISYAKAPAEQQQEEKKKDIVAEATSKIFDEDAAKKGGPVPVSESANPGPSGGPVTAIKSEPTPGPSGGPVRQGGPVSVGRPRGSRARGPRGGRGSRGGRGRGGASGSQQILPRLHLLEDEDDGLTCRMCLQSFWYKSQLTDHLKANHLVTDPEKYEREEREKRMRRMREDQQRHILGKRHRMGMGGRGFRGGMRGRIGPGGRPVGPPKPAGPRPSFQYRDGAFICDLCKKSFSDGNDMVTHWKSHVKKQRMEGGGMMRGRRGRGGMRPRSPDYGERRRGRGRGRAGRPPGGGRGRGRGRGRSDKGMPRWTAYLVWSTRRRKEIAQEGEGLSFGEVAKTISNEWKEISEEEKSRYQEEAEDMNDRGVRKTQRPQRDRDSDADSSSSWSSDSDDPTFEELEALSRKPMMPRIKKEGGAEGEDEDEDDDEDYEYDERPRSTRKRKRPSFFQEFENEENNLDKILDEFEMEQIEESKKPKEKKTPVPRPEGAAPRRRRRKQAEIMAEEEELMGPKEPVELEKSRSGRIRKKTKFQDYFKKVDEAIGGTEELSSGEPSDDGEFQPDDSEPDEPEEEFVEQVESENDGYGDYDDEEEEDDLALPPKKRKGAGMVMTDAEIEEATRQAMSAKPMVRLDENGSDEEDEGDDEVEAKRKKLDEAAGEGTSSEKPAWISEEAENVEASSKDGEQQEGGEKAPETKETSKEEEDGKTDEAQEEKAAQQGDEAEEGSKAAENSAAAEGSESAEGSAAAESSESAEGNQTAEDSEVTAKPLEEVPVAPPAEEVNAAEPQPEQAPKTISENMQVEQSEDVSAPTEEIQEAVGGITPAAIGDDDAIPAPVVEEAIGEAAAAVGDESAADLLASTSADRMEEGDDKFKDIIAEGQIDNIFN